MADPQAAVQTQLKNVQSKTGRTIADLHQAVAATGLAKHGEKRTWLMAQFKLGYGDANMVANFIGKPLPDLGTGARAAQPTAAEGDPLDAIYAGAKAPLRPLHDAVMAAVQALGDFEAAPKKSTISLRRKKQFAMVGPATKDALEIGLNAKDLPPLRISAIVDARFSLIVDGETASSRTRRGGAQARGENVAQPSTISLKRPPARGLTQLFVGLD